MNLAEIRQATKNLIFDSTKENGSLLLNKNNNVLDDFINQAVEIVYMDLAEFIQESHLLDYETFNLQAGVDKYTLSHPFTRIMAVKQNQDGDFPKIIRYFNTLDELEMSTVGETGEPRGWTLKGDYIMVRPIPDVDYDGWAKIWFTATENDTMSTAGPRILPSKSHRLIPLMSAILIGKQAGVATGGFEQLYTYYLERVRVILGFRVQQQPRFVRPGFSDQSAADSRLPNFYDTSEYFD
jgi:hypothetical protein